MQIKTVLKTVYKRILRHKWRILFGLLISVTIGALLYTTIYLIQGNLWLSNDDKKARMQTNGPYKATVESLNTHPVPEWFNDAKFGLFLHWGIFSVPAYAPNGEYVKVLQTNYDHAMTTSPYAEDYANAIKDPSSPTAQYHAATYGNAPYENFKSTFERDLKDWDARAWAKQFKSYGVKYIVVTAKYHDGFSLWPTEIENPHQPNWHSKRDVLGELAAAVRAEDMKFGIYYSGGVDWTFQPNVVKTLGDYIYRYHGDYYADYADAQMRELIIRYKPDILWNDISWPSGEKRLFALMADYYNTVPDGVVNDRWQTANGSTKFMGTWLGRGSIDLLMKAAIANDPNFVENVKPPLVPHSDYTTPEYTQYSSVQPKKWETTRGIGYSYGYNRNETDERYASFENKLFPDFIDAIAKNGNLLLNVGPDGGKGTIPELQNQRLMKFAQWLNVNGDAVYETTPWRIQQTTTENNQQVRFTAKDGKIYAIIIGKVPSTTVRLKNVVLPGSAQRVSNKEHVTVEYKDKDTIITFLQIPDEFSPVVQFSD